MTYRGVELANQFFTPVLSGGFRRARTARTRRARRGLRAGSIFGRFGHYFSLLFSRDADGGDAADGMYSHCRDEHLVEWRRGPPIVRELLAYRTGVVSMQEVDADVFDDPLRPTMRATGYEGSPSPRRSKRAPRRYIQRRFADVARRGVEPAVKFWLPWPRGRGSGGRGRP